MIDVVLPVQMNKVSVAVAVPRRQKDEWHKKAREHPMRNEVS